MFLVQWFKEKQRDAQGKNIMQHLNLQYADLNLQGTNPLMKGILLRGVPSYRRWEVSSDVRYSPMRGID